MSATETRPAVDERRRFEGAWQTKRLGDTCTASSGGTPNSKTLAFYGGNVPWASVSDITEQGRFLDSTERHLSQLGLARSTARLWPAGTILYAMYASPGECSISTIKVSSSQAILGIQCGNEADRDFLYYRLAYSQRDILGSIQRGTQANLNKGNVLGLEFSFPPLPEQRAIAAALSDVDDLLQSLDRLIAKKRDVKQGAMQQLLTGTTRLPGFEGAWETKQLGELGHWRGGATPLMSNASYWSPAEIPWLTSSDVRQGRVSDEPARISQKAIDDRRAPMMPAGSVVMVIRSGILRRFLPVAALPHSVAINQDLRAIAPSPRHDPTFLEQVLLGRSELILQRCLKSGTTVESIDSTWFRSFEIQLPPLPEQRAIAAVLSDMDAEIDALEARRDKVAAIKQGMMQELLTGRTRLPTAEEAIDA